MPADLLPPDLLAGVVAHDPAAPLLTYYDLGTGERTELSAVTLANWVAKTANLLVEGLDVSPEDTVGVAIGPHWQTAAILLATWATGAAATDRSEPCDVLFCSEARLEELRDSPARELLATSLHPLGAPLSAPRPPHVLDYAVEVRAYADSFTPVRPDPQGIALRAGGFELTHAGLAGAAVELSGRLELAPGHRMLATTDAASTSGPVSWLLAPLAARTSVVLVHGAEGRADELTRLADAERCTDTL